MGVTQKLLALYLVDRQLAGLKGRLRSAEAYLKQQDTHLKDIEARRAATALKLRHAESSAHNLETEVKGIDDRIAKLRDRMNTAATSKEHAALLTEVSTIKADRGRLEEQALAALSEAEQLRTAAAALDTEKTDRDKVRAVAAADREARAAEIKDRVAELEAQRVKALAEVPPTALAKYDALVAAGIDEVMAPIEEQDRRNKDYSCGGCYTHIPLEKLSTLLNQGEMVVCPSCNVILYIEETLRTSITGAAEKKRSSRKVEA
jgi:predicted  nucleic acid-binding Zn-ribbon protein